MAAKGLVGLKKPILQKMKIGKFCEPLENGKKSKLWAIIEWATAIFLAIWNKEISYNIF